MLSRKRQYEPGRITQRIPTKNPACGGVRVSAAEDRSGWQNGAVQIRQL